MILTGAAPGCGCNVITALQGHRCRPSNSRYTCSVCSAALRQEKKRARSRPFSRECKPQSRDRQQIRAICWAIESGIFGIEEQTAAVENLRQAGGFGGKDGHAGSHGFDELQPETFVARRMHKRKRTLIHRGQVFVGNAVGAEDSLG